MSSRHTRRKLAKARLEAKLEALAMAEKSRQVAKVVKANKAAPIERNYYPASSMGRLSETAARAQVTGHSSGIIYKDRTRFKRWKG